MAEYHGSYHSGSFTQRKRRCYTAADGLPCDKVNCVAIFEGKVYAGTDAGLFVLKGESFEPAFEETVYGAVRSIDDLGGRLAVCAGKTLYTLTGESIEKTRVFDDELVKAASVGGAVWILTESKLYKTDAECKVDSLERWLEGGRGLSLAANGENTYVSTEKDLLIVHGKRMEWKNISPEYGRMPEGSIFCLSFDSTGCLWLGTENGLAIFDNKSAWVTSAQVPSLPRNPTSVIAADKAGGKYFATDAGLAVLKNGRLKYLAAERWIPSNSINGVAVTDDGGAIYAATDKGLSEIVTYRTTLAEKAAVYEKDMERYFIRRGFTATRHFEGSIENGTVDISDNDGLWTACYVAAESFRYGATKDPDALQKARRGMRTLLFLENTTGLPGFTARAVRYPGEEDYGDGDNEWSLTPDGECEWKGETSSDEMTGHFFGLSIYYDLCADESEKADIRASLCAILDHIIANGYRLIDRDGLPTTWACWDPQQLNYSDKWFAERGVNSLEFLAFLKVGCHISGDGRYDKLYDSFIKTYNYPLNVMHHKVKDAHTCHIDDNLGFLASLTLLRLEEDEDVRSFVLCGMEDHWRYERVENQPLFCFVHAAFTGNDEDIGEGVKALRDIPADLIHYRMMNSKRRGLEFDTEQEEIGETPQLKCPLPWDERNIHRPDGSCFELDSSRHDTSQEPTVFLLPYYIAKYYGLIEE